MIYFTHNTLQGFYYSDDNSVVIPSNTIIINAKENDFSSTRTVETILPTPKVETISHVEELGTAIQTSTDSSIDFDVQLPVEVTTWYVQYIYA